MLNVVVAWPSIDVNAAAETAKVWKDRGYATCVLFENDPELPDSIDMKINDHKWKGFPAAANVLCHTLASTFDIVVIGGDDLYPDPNKSPLDIMMHFKDHFGGTFGLMSPIGDDYGAIKDAAICPWIGAEYILKMYGGYGPYWEGYYHYYCDGELQDVESCLIGSYRERISCSTITTGHAIA